MSSDARPVRTIADQMVACMARELGGFAVLQLGLASPLGQVAACVARDLHPHLLLEDPAALTLNDTPRQATLTRAETVALHGALCQFDAPAWIADVMPTLAGRAGQFIRPLEIDLRGRINTLRVRRRDGAWLRVAGLAGLAELAALLHPFLVYLPRHDRRCLVDEVQFCTADPLRHGHAGAAARVVVVSDLAVIDIDCSGARVRSVHAGVDRAQLHTQSPPALTIGEPPVTAAPSAAEFAAIARIDALGIRELEFLAGGERRSRLAAIARQEADMRLEKWV